MAEFHLVGEITGGTGFKNKNIFCKWGVHSGPHWELLEGYDSGQTQVDHPEDGEFAVWSHPLDVHYLVRALSGWPKLHFQVWSQDVHGQVDLCGYGFCHVPTAPGVFELECPTWAPEGSTKERLLSYFIGRGPRLKVEEVVYSPDDRYRLQTLAGGTVFMRMGVIMKDFEQHHIKFG